MEPYSLNIGDITYMSELTPPSMHYTLGLLCLEGGVQFDHTIYVTKVP
jgi:hypothetical protein